MRRTLVYVGETPQRGVEYCLKRRHLSIWQKSLCWNGATFWNDDEIIIERRSSNLMENLKLTANHRNGAVKDFYQWVDIVLYFLYVVASGINDIEFVEAFVQLPQIGFGRLFPHLSCQFFQVYIRFFGKIRLYDKCCGDTLCVLQHLFFCAKRGEIRMIKPAEFVSYVDSLPEECIEIRTEDEIRFHIPRVDDVKCPSCGSHHTDVHQYRLQTLQGIPNATKRYVYNRRRYRCQDCGRTFVENSPFLAERQRRIGNRLRQIRAQKKITQGQVMEAVGIPLYLYKRYEDDTDAEVPPTLVAMQIANYLGADVLEIWGDQIGGGSTS